MTKTRLQTLLFLALLLAAQWLGGVHGVNHLSGPDDQACSQCLQGKPKQHAVLSLFAMAQAAGADVVPGAPPAMAIPAATRRSAQPRAPPAST